MAFKQRYFHKDKPYTDKLRPVYRFKTSTEPAGIIEMKKTIVHNLILVLLITVVSTTAISLGSEGVLPIANAGSSRYAAQEPVILDGTGSYDPDNSGPLNLHLQ
jgi:hypothetical protein